MELATELIQEIKSSSLEGFIKALHAFANEPGINRNDLVNAIGQCKDFIEFNNQTDG